MFTYLIFVRNIESGTGIADTERRKLDLKEKEIELEDLQQLSEIRRNIVSEQRRQCELLKVAQVKTLFSITYFLSRTAKDDSCL